jgi:hypothetical protein
VETGVGLFDVTTPSTVQVDVDGGAAALDGGGPVPGTLTIAPEGAVACEVQRVTDGVLRLRFPAAARFRGLETLDVDVRSGDPSFTRAAVASALFRARGVLAPRVGLAVVRGTAVGATLPGLVQDGVDDRLLRRTFPSTAHLYGTAGDLTAEGVAALQVIVGDAADTTDVVATATALQPFLTAPGFLAGGADAFRMGATIRFLAIDGWLGHDDGYGRARGDVFVHIDDGGETRLLPGDLDGMSLTGDVVPVGSALHTACANDPPCVALLEEELTLTSAAVVDADLEGVIDGVKTGLALLPGVDANTAEAVRAALLARVDAVDTALGAP